MNNTMIYKGYIGSVEFSEEDCLFYGSLQGIKILVDYDGATAKQLIEDFNNAVDNYLEVCTEEGIEPERTYKGSFNIRISPDLHKKAAIYAINHNVSLNSVVEQALQKALV